MSITAKASIFVVLTFAISWSVVIGAWAMGLHNSPMPATATLTAMMFGPAIAAVVCVFTLEKSRRAEALGLRFKPNLWWLFAWLLPIAIALASVVLTVALSDRGFADPVAQTVVAASASINETQAAALRTDETLGITIVVAALFIGPLINTPILTLSEELGWRGYLHDLWRPFGFWRASIASGVVWGIWHAPAILLFGLNYPDNRELGAALFILFCVLLAPLMTFLRDRGGSTWAPGIMHGTINAVAGLTLLSLTDASFPWSGIAGIGGLVALALAAVMVALLRHHEVGREARPRG